MKVSIMSLNGETRTFQVGGKDGKPPLNGQSVKAQVSIDGSMHAAEIAAYSDKMFSLVKVGAVLEDNVNCTLVVKDDSYNGNQYKKITVKALASAGGYQAKGGGYQKSVPSATFDEYSAHVTACAKLSIDVLAQAGLDRQAFAAVFDKILGVSSVLVKVGTQTAQAEAPQKLQLTREAYDKEVSRAYAAPLNEQKAALDAIMAKVKQAHAEGRCSDSLFTEIEVAHAFLIVPSNAPTFNDDDIPL